MTQRRAALLVACAALAAYPLRAQRVEPPRLSRPTAMRAPALRLGGAGAQSPAPTRATHGRVVLQILGATLGAVAGGAAGYVFANNPAHDRVRGDAGYNPDGNTGFAIGSFVGATVVSYGIGRLDGSHGSLAMTALGAAIPALPIAAARNDPYAYYAAVLLLVPAEGIGSTIGYQSTRTARAR